MNASSKVATSLKHLIIISTRIFLKVEEVLPVLLYFAIPNQCSLFFCCNKKQMCHKSLVRARIDYYTMKLESKRCAFTWYHTSDHECSSAAETPPHLPLHWLKSCACQKDKKQHITLERSSSEVVNTAANPKLRHVESMVHSSRNWAGLAIAESSDLSRSSASAFSCAWRSRASSSGIVRANVLSASWIRFLTSLSCNRPP